ncbi:4-hydroxy-tetrahydrodipicolinate reductase [Alistipes sp. OttesenSCG-928-B03]|nr:4-hydroxy-tetrahydrodipicolinate reductase [Alistipes sp. OttesenSCG-928-B03]
MNAALVGYGKMGREIGRLLEERGHTVVLIVDENNPGDLDTENLREKQVDVAFEFTTPETAFTNICRCLEAGVAVVSGTTGWLDRMDEVRALCEKLGGAFFYASNFSVGMNVFFCVNKALARMMDGFPEYDVAIEEIHHIHKKDAPSGTAITLAEQVVDATERKTGWVLGEGGGEEIGITALREGEVPGTHTVEWDSPIDTITITHQAKNRRGLAQGAVMAGEFVAGKTGIYTMSDLLGL